METKKQSIITLHNIDDEDFVFEYNASEGNAPYVIPAGEVARYPAWLADHALNHLIDKILTKRKMKTNNQVARNEVGEQIVIGEELLRQERVLTEAERLQKEILEMNQASSLDTILERRKKEGDTLKKEEEETTEQEVVEEKFEGLEEKNKKLDKKLDEIKKEKKVVPLPTRKELYEYAEKQNMVLDAKDKEGKTFRSKLDKMKVDELIKELQYPLDD